MSSGSLANSGTATASGSASASVELPGSWTLAERIMIKKALSHSAFAEKLAHFQAATSDATFAIEYDFCRDDWNLTGTPTAFVE
jgi:hypothetical protein